MRKHGGRGRLAVHPSICPIIPSIHPSCANDQASKLTLLVEAQRGWLSRRVGGRVCQAGHGHGGSVPGVVTWPPLSVEQSQLVVHRALAHHLLVLGRQVSQDTIDWWHLVNRVKKTWGGIIMMKLWQCLKGEQDHYRSVCMWRGEGSIKKEKDTRKNRTPPPKRMS